MISTILASIVLLLVLVLVARLVRRSSSLAQAVNNGGGLRSYLTQDRDYKFFVGFPLESPSEWKPVGHEGLTLSLDNTPIRLDEIRSFLVVYPNGQILTAQEEFFPLPTGVRFVEGSSESKHDVLDVAALNEGNRFVRITFGQSASRPNEPGHYSTTIRNISSKKLRVTKFGGFSRSLGSYRLNTISGDYFSGDEFISWYGADQDGWIRPGASVSDPNNYGSGDGYWVYYFETENGDSFVAGARHNE